MEIRQKVLRDFLLDDSNSCSSSGFKTFPRKNFNPLEKVNHNHHYSPSLTTKSPFQAIFNTIKTKIPLFTLVKSPSFLPRSLSGKKKTSVNIKEDNKRRLVTIKDIMRWRSFRDLVEEESQPLDSNTTITTGSTSTTNSSRCSSWCDSDFTADDLPLWTASDSEEEACGEKGNFLLPCVGVDSMRVIAQEETTTAVTDDESVDPSQQEHVKLILDEDEEQNSPISVYQFEEDHEDFLSSFDQSLANVEKSKQKLMQRIQIFESMVKLDPTDLEKWASTEENKCEDDNEQEEEEEPNEIERKVRWLMQNVKQSNGSLLEHEELLVVNFFRDKLETHNDNVEEYDQCNIVRMAVDWLSGQNGNGMCMNWGIEQGRASYLEEIDREWKFKQGEKHEVALDIEHGLLSLVIDELLNDLLLLP